MCFRPSGKMLLTNTPSLGQSLAQELVQPREMPMNGALISHGTEIKPEMMQVGEEGSVSEVAEKFGGPCRGRTYGPLIKRDKKPFLTKLAIATVSPI